MPRKFTKEEDDFLRGNYTKIPAKRMAIMLGRSEGTGRQRMKILGLIVPPEIVAKFRYDSQIKPGNIPPTKGKRQSEYMSAEAIQRTTSTRFKTGDLPKNTLFDNAITIRADKQGKLQKYIRVALGKWQELRRYNWEKVHGKIPPKMNIVFKDGDTMNCEVGNLEMLSNSELMSRNTFHNYPKEIASTIQLGGVLTRQINKQLKKIKHEKQNQ